MYCLPVMKLFGRGILGRGFFIHQLSHLQLYRRTIPSIPRVRYKIGSFLHNSRESFPAFGKMRFHRSHIKYPATVPIVFMIKSSTSVTLRQNNCHSSIPSDIKNPVSITFLGFRKLSQINGSKKPSGINMIIFRI